MTREKSVFTQNPPYWGGVQLSQTSMSGVPERFRSNSHVVPTGSFPVVPQSELTWLLEGVKNSLAALFGWGIVID